jgi:hypothetical protein
MTVPAHSPNKKAVLSRQLERRRYQEAAKESNALQIEAKRQQEAYILAEGGEDVGIKSCLTRDVQKDITDSVIRVNRKLFGLHE